MNLSLRRSTSALLASSLLLTIGRGATLPFMTIYLSRQYSLSVDLIGYAMTIALTIGVVFSLGFGILADKFDKKRYMLLAITAFASGFIAIPLVNNVKLVVLFFALINCAYSVFATVLNYLGKDPNSTKADDYTGPATDLLLKLRPNIRYFHSSQYINDLANGDICVAIGWAGDVWQASNRAKEAKNGVNVSFSIPKEGAMAFFDVFAMPADAKNKDEAYQFLNYLLRPDVVAHISDNVFYANANKAATPLVSAEVRENPGIYPPADVRAKLFTLKVQDPKIDRVRTRAWTKVKSGK